MPQQRIDLRCAAAELHEQFHRLARPAGNADTDSLRAPIDLTPGGWSTTTFAQLADLNQFAAGYEARGDVTVNAGGTITATSVRT